MLTSLTKYNLLYVCLVLFSVTSILCDCPIPKRKHKNVRFLYQSPNDANMTVLPENYLLRFRCSRGHTRIGPKAIVCLGDKWTDIVPSCTKMQCSDPPPIENGQYSIRSGSSSIPWIGSSAIYSCRDGFELMNDTVSSMHCDLDPASNRVRWLGEIPVCIRKESCSDPGVSPDGYRVGDCCFRGDILQFVCKEEFELVGSSEIQCLSTGNWSSERPLCRPRGDHCELPPTIPHGKVKGSKEGDFFQSEEEVEIDCEPGYAYKGSSRFILCEDGEWDEEFGECEEIFCNLPDPLINGTITELESTNATNFPFLFEITYICDEGYRLVGGDSWRFCDKKGWSGKTPYCEEIRCPDPGVPEHGVRDGHSFEIGSKVHFKCFSGYDLLGSFERYCMPNGQWTGELARCDIESNYCPNPGIPINGIKNSSDYNMGDRVGFSCQPKLLLVGSEVRECLPNRTWSGTEARCLGPYDYDVSAKVRDTLKLSISEKAEEQKEKLREYRKALYSDYFNGTSVPQGRILNINYPGRLILYFVFDVSGSVGEHNFRKSIEFAKAIVKRVGISENGARAGALTFSSKAEVQFLPLIHTTTEQVLEALDGLNFTGGGTSATSALTLVREESIPLTQAVLGKKGQKSVVFVLTDGRANMGGNPKAEADLLKDANVEIYSIGITGDISQKALYDIASDPKDEHVFILDNYATLSWLIQEITNGTINYAQCGLGLETIGNQISRGRIINGKKAKDPWPWMAALYFIPIGENDPATAELQCGGSIIHEHYILTAAHCMYDMNNKPRTVKQIIVKLGLTNVNNQTYIQEPEILRVIRHPKYQHERTYDYDIALLQLKNPIEFNAYVRPICLPPVELAEETLLYHPTQFGLATGWGHEGIVHANANIRIKSTDHLKELILPIQSREGCIQSLVEHRMLPSLYTDRMFCAGDGLQGNDTCRGDSGGPLMQSQLNHEGYVYWTQVGIVSWGIGCGLANTYGYYTHVQRLRLWIDDTIQSAPNNLNDID